MRTGVGVCPCCGQRMLIRHGVKLSPKKADMFDVIARVTEADSRITVETLAGIFYPGIAAGDAKAAVRVTINQINDLLEETEITIGSKRPDGYRLEKRCGAT
jgi:hypothetical protein